MKTLLPTMPSCISGKSLARGRFFAHLGLFLGMFSLTTFGIKLLFPNQSATANNIAVVDEKIDFFSKNKDSYDALFVGSSRVYRQVSPQLFDQALASQGHPLRSFNFGVLAMKLPETSFWLKRILALKPANVKWVFVEVDLESLYSPIENAQSSREIYWHTPAQTAFSVHYTLGSNQDPLKKGTTVFSHLLPFFYHTINLGRVANILVNVSGTPDKVLQALGPDGDGFTPLDFQPNVAFQARQQALLRNAAQRDRQVAQLQQDAQAGRQMQGAHLSASEIAFLQQTSRQIEAIGAKPIFIIAPRVKNEADLLAAGQQGYIKTLFAFNNPVKYPELYRFDQQFDEEHLNRSGAEKFTRLIADRFADYLKTSAAQAPASEPPGSKPPGSEPPATDPAQRAQPTGGQ